MISLAPAFTLPATLDCSAAALPEPVAHARLIVGQLQSGIVWCIICGDARQMRGECRTFEEARGVQVRAGIWDVQIGGLRTSEALAAAHRYGWEHRFDGLPPNVELRNRSEARSL